ncbi:Uroporphyrinogen-III synthase [Tolypocladium ophioglossoides CBS 100239]|uniref:Uroporphyrinogen-III synthase n=1 Tax=Tolypocladium ophioglossoides (strain CBS 100239) TaxID=1163406 RepID=A0A0L0NG62_TOLOC|nr:Uroporphyrinogen-III synthase [Tolypocladium ophioglossoides CBS 100239]
MPLPPTPSDSPVATPVLLLKTRSTPGDAYEELLSATPSNATHGRRLAPRFVPVLLHRFEDEGTGRLNALLRRRQIGNGEHCAFGGLIFTSQRAVEAFAKVVDEGRDNDRRLPDDPSWPHLQNVPIYSVGPATTRALKAVLQDPPLQIFGEHTGNGEALARFILQHYGQWYRDRPARPPLLFLVGEQRRDIIARTLADAALPAHAKIRVDEEVVYGTGVMESFPADFDAVLRETAAAPSRWVVVFSPTGCDSMLRGLGLLDAATGKARLGLRDGRTFIATIGPTTRTYLMETFGFEPDVCADTPSPEGVLQGVAEFESKRR